MIVYMFDVNGDYAGSEELSEAPANGTVVPPDPLPQLGYSSPRWNGTGWVYRFGFYACVE